MKNIHFNKNAEALVGVDTDSPVLLLEVFIKDIQNTGPEFRTYLTTDTEANTIVETPDTGRYIVLLFTQNGKMFAALRKFTTPRCKYYYGMRGSVMKIQLT